MQIKLKRKDLSEAVGSVISTSSYVAGQKKKGLVYFCGGQRFTPVVTRWSFDHCGCAWRPFVLSHHSFAGHVGTHHIIIKKNWKFH